MPQGESHVEVAPDGTGKNVRSLQVTTDEAGVQTTSYQQVVTLADEFGDVIDQPMTETTGLLLLAALRDIALVLRLGLKVRN